MAIDDSPSDGAAEPDRDTSGEVRRWVLWSVAVGCGLVGWFFIAWRGLHRPVLDAIGESVGAAFALLVLISIIGAFRGRR